MARILPIVADPPAEYTRAIGRIMTHWSYVEWMLRRVTYRLLNLDPKRGRVAIREPRADEYIAMFRQLMRLNNIDVAGDLLDALPQALSDAKGERDLVAHSIWMRDDETGAFLIPKTGGNWPADKGGIKISRKELPEGIEVNLDGLEKLRLYIVDIATALEKLHWEVDQALSSQSKSPPQSQQDRPQDDPKEKTPAPQPEESQER